MLHMHLKAYLPLRTRDFVLDLCLALIQTHVDPEDMFARDLITADASIPCDFNNIAFLIGLRRNTKGLTKNQMCHSSGLCNAACLTSTTISLEVFT